METITRIGAWCVQTAVACVANVLLAVCVLVLAVIAAGLVGVLCLSCSILDHFIPLGKGGSNGQDNLRLACRDCNKRKGAKMPEARRA